MAGKIFINYRREDSIAIAGRLHDRLAEAFGRDNLFMDIDNIPIGINFYEYLKSEMADCDAVLSVIGPNWLNAKDDTGQRRLDKPDDFVAIEISIALAGDILVVPVLVDGTRMPGASELPSSLKPFALRNAIQVRNTSFGSDAEQLIKKMREAFALGRPERSKGKANLLLFAAQGVASFLLSIAAFFIVLGFFLLLPGLYSRIGYNFTDVLSDVVCGLVHPLAGQARAEVRSCDRRRRLSDDGSGYCVCEFLPSEPARWFLSPGRMPADGYRLWALCVVFRHHMEEAYRRLQ
jgi:TIR domain